jgi:hypothetical protein
MPVVFGVALEAIIAFCLNAFRLLMANQLGRWIVQALAFMGLSYGVAKLVAAPALDLLTSHMHSSPGGQFAADAIAWLGVLRLDEAISMLISAIAIKRGAQAAKAGFYMAATRSAGARVPVGAPR